MKVGVWNEKLRSRRASLLVNRQESERASYFICSMPKRFSSLSDSLPLGLIRAYCPRQVRRWNQKISETRPNRRRLARRLPTQMLLRSAMINIASLRLS
jgi:hypothetical protein